MAKPPKSQVLLEVKAVEAAADDAARPGEKRSLRVTAHRLWIAEGREIPLADVQSARLTAARTLSLRRIGQERPFEFHLKSVEDARRLRACLVFYARATRGGFPGLEDWTQLLESPFDRVDVGDAALPSAPGPAVAAASGVGPAVTGPTRRTSIWPIIAGVVAAGLVVAVVVYVALALTVGGGRPKQASPQDYQRFYEQGEAAFKRGDYQSALTSYRQALGASPRAAEANARIGEALVKLNRHAEAIQYLDAAMRYDPQNRPEYRLALARCYIAAKKYDEAIIELRRARREAADSPDLNYLLARAYDLQGHSEQALAPAARAYRDAPQDEEGARLYAALLEKAKQFAPAADVYLRVAAAKRDYAAYLSAITCAAKSGNLKRAESIVQQAARACPERANLRGDPEDVLVRLGLMEKPAPPEPPKPPEPPPMPEPVEPPKPPETPTPQPVEPPVPPETPTPPGPETPATPEGTQEQPAPDKPEGTADESGTTSSETPGEPPSRPEGELRTDEPRSTAP